MAYDELLKALNQFDVSVLNSEQLKTFGEALQVKLTCVNFYKKVAHRSENLVSSSKKCGD